MMKTILLHVQDDARLDDRVENALAIARAADAHLDVLHIVPDEAEAVFESFGGIDVDGQGLERLRRSEDALEAHVRAELEREDVSWDYRRVTGPVVGTLAASAALADLVVTGRLAHGASRRASAAPLLGDLLHASRAPLFVRGDEQARFDPFGPALIAWDGSFEAANAVRGAAGLLRLAGSVEVVRVIEDGEASDQERGLYPSTRLLEYCSRLGIHADYRTLDEEGGKVSATLIGHARATGAGLLVAGGYSHNRIAERLFGGVTRSLLSACPMALAISH